MVHTQLSHGYGILTDPAQRSHRHLAARGETRGRKEM